MKIAILNHYAGVPEVAGSEVRHYEIAKRFVEDGHEVDIFIGNYSHLIGRPWTEIKADTFQKDGVLFVVINVKPYTGNSLKRLISSWEYYFNGRKKILNRYYDVIIASSPHPFSWSLAEYYLKRSGKAKYFVEIRDVWPDDLIKFRAISKYNPIIALFDFMCRKHYRISDGVISLIPDLNEHFSRLKVKPKKFLYLPNGVNIEDFENPTRCEIVDKMVESLTRARRKKILYVGSILPHKWIKEFIGLLKNVDKNLLKNFLFAFIGPGDEKYIEEIRRTIAEGKLDDVIKMFSAVPKKCIPYLLSKSDVLLFLLTPSNLTFPANSSYKVLDYMASGRPILSVDIDGLLFKKTKGALFFKNSEDLSSSLKRIIEDEEIREIGIRNVEYIYKHRTWNALYEKLKTFIFGNSSSHFISDK